MDWTAIGAIGEIGGAIGVIVTLVYLAGQLRQNTKALRSSTYQSYNETTDSYWDFHAQHAATLAEIFEEDRPLSELTSEQQLVATSDAMKAFNLFESTFLHHRAGSMDDDVFEGKVSGFRHAMQSPFLRGTWEQLRFMAFSDDFRRFMDEELIGTQSGSRTYSVSRPLGGD